MSPKFRYDAADRPLLHARDVLVGHAEQPEDHERRQVAGQVGDQVGVPAGRERVDRLDRERADLRLERGDPARRERLLDEAAQARVVGRLAAGEPGRVAHARLVEDRLHLGRPRLERRLRVLATRTSPGP